MASYKDFLFGGLSGMIATAAIQPVDTVKVRIQLIGESAKGASTSPFVVGRNIIAKEGVRGLYKGLDSALFRQATYGTARLGFYKFLFNKRLQQKGEVIFREKVAISLASGILGTIVGNPSDLALVRFQSDSYLPPEQRRNYRHVFDAFGRIIKEEGFLALWRGALPTMYRAIAINVSMLTTYDEWLNRNAATKDTQMIRLQASAISGVALSLVTLPFDNLKTKLQKMTPDALGKYQYSGTLDCLKQTIRREGVLGLWVGDPTFYARVAPHSMLVLLVQDYLHINFGSHK